MRYFLFSEPHWLHNKIVVLWKHKQQVENKHAKKFPKGGVIYEQYEYVTLLIRLN